MPRMWLFRTSSLAFIFSMIAFQLAAQGGDTNEIQQRLNAQFRLTHITADRTDIVTPGSIVALHKDGMMMYSITSPLPPSNTYRNGKILQGWGGFGKDLAITMNTHDGGTAASYPKRKFVAEEKCWITGIQVEKDGVLVQLFSDPYDDIRYYGNLKIPFPNKKEVPSSETALQLVAEVVSEAPADQQSAPPPSPIVAPAQEGPPPPRAVVPVSEIAPPPRTDSPMQEIPPPPPATVQMPDIAPPPTIALGQTKDQVVAAFGQPARVAKLGPKEILYYKDMKVTLVNGKVSNVE